MRKLPLPKIGHRFGRLRFIEFVGIKKTPRCQSAMWLMGCDCGKSKVVRSADVKAGKTKSCGCLTRQMTALKNFKHGFSKRGKRIRLYSVWAAMKTRCSNRNQGCWKNYGGRGIRVCRRWSNSFMNFYLDMSSGYRRGLTIERKNNDKGYSPSNCTWATRAEQNRNQRNSSKYANRHK